MSARLWGVIAFFLVGATLVLFASVFNQDFVAYDDGAYVTGNPLVNQGVSWTGVWEAFTTLNSGASYWHPLTWISHQVDYAFFGPVAGWHKLVNVIFHCFNTVILFGLLYRVKKSLGPPAAVAALFAWHPLHVESVVWVSERKDLLSTFFGFVTFHCYLDYRLKQTRVRYVLVVMSCACALMSKPMMVTLPVLLLLLDFWVWNENPTALGACDRFSRLLWDKIPLLIMSLGVGIVTVLAQNELGIMPSVSELPVSFRVANALQSYWIYAAQSVVPVGLAVCYPYPETFALGRVFLALVFFVFVSMLAVRARVRRPYITFGWAWFVVSLLPVIGLIQTSTQARADRYTYLPLVGLFVLLIWGMNELVSRHRQSVFWILGCVALAVYVPLSWRQIGFWENSVTLFRRAVNVTDGNVLMHVALADSLDWNLETEDASYHYRRAVDCDPENWAVYESAARFFRNRRNLGLERIYLQKSLFWSPNQPDLLNRLAHILACHPDPCERNRDLALELATQACALQTPGAMLYEHTLAAAMANSGDFSQAVRLTEAALGDKSVPQTVGILHRLDLYRQGLPYRDLLLPRRNTGPPHGN